MVYLNTYGGKLDHVINDKHRLALFVTLTSASGTMAPGKAICRFPEALPVILRHNTSTAL